MQGRMKQELTSPHALLTLSTTPIKSALLSLHPLLLRLVHSQSSNVLTLIELYY